MELRNLHLKDDLTLPLCVDLDGTLVKTDTLVECFVAALRNVRIFLYITIWLFRGKSIFKSNLAKYAPPRIDLLPYNEIVIRFLESERKKGRRLILTTAANKIIAESVNKHLKLFEDTIASNDSLNLRGKNKAKELITRFGEHGFLYIGNDTTDLHIWRVAKRGFIVNATNRIIKLTKNCGDIEVISYKKSNIFKSLFNEIRVHQWVKNLLVFVPIITANAFYDTFAWANAFLTFCAFSLTASSTYIINDLFDLENDREHPRKKTRPLANGSLPLKAGLIISPIMLILGILLGYTAGVLLLVLLYIIITLAYSIKLKKILLVDIFTLSLLYTIRLFAGGYSTRHYVSLWLLAFSCFVFFSLANIKRVAELINLIKFDKKSAKGRSYYINDLHILQSMGISSSFASSIVLALYMQSDVVKNAYNNPDLLWGVVPLFLYMQCRLWLATSRGIMHDDPIVFAFYDKVSWIIGLIILLIIIAARLPF